MYLRGSKLNMNRRRRRSNPFFIGLLVVLIAGFVYVDRVIVPTTPPLFVATPTPTRNPESFIADAESFFAEGKINQAMDSYRAAVQADPRNPANYVSLARLQMFSGQYDAALENSETALLLNPNNPLAHAIRGWALGYITPPDYLQAANSFKEALAIDGNNAIAHALNAEVLALQYERGTGTLDMLDQAIEESRIARDLDPNLLEVHRVRGYIYSLTSEYADAVNELKAAIEINANIADLHMQLGINYLALEQLDNAIDEFIRANSLNPQDPMPNYYISRAYARYGEFPRAVQYAEAALAADPSDPILHGNLGSQYYKTEEYTKGIPELRLAIQGGTTKDGVVVEGIPLSNDRLTLEFYNRYGLMLARTNQCAESVAIAAAIIQGVPEEEDSVYNANEMIRICQENLDNPPTPEPTQP